MENKDIPLIDFNDVIVNSLDVSIRLDVLKEELRALDNKGMHVVALAENLLKNIYKDQKIQPLNIEILYCAHSVKRSTEYYSLEIDYVLGSRVCRLKMAIQI